MNQSHSGQEINITKTRPETLQIGQIKTETGTETETETGTETVTGTETETETETDPVTAQAILHRCRVTGETVDLAQAHQAQEDKVGYIQGPMKQYVPFKLILCSVKI